MVIINNRLNLIDNIDCAIKAENTIGNCYKRLARLIKNGRVRKRFLWLADKAESHKTALIQHFSRNEMRKCQERNECKFCKVNPDSFSLIGALNLEEEAARAASRFYKHMSHSSQNAEDRELFKRLYHDESTQLKFLKKEKEFHSHDDEKHDTIKVYCIPEIISNLWI